MLTPTKAIQTAGQARYKSWLIKKAPLLLKMG